MAQAIVGAQTANLTPVWRRHQRRIDRGPASAGSEAHIKLRLFKLFMPVKTADRNGPAFKLNPHYTPLVVLSPLGKEIRKKKCSLQEGETRRK